MLAEEHCKAARHLAIFRFFMEGVSQCPLDFCLVQCRIVEASAWPQAVHASCLGVLIRSSG